MLWAVLAILGTTQIDRLHAQLEEDGLSLSRLLKKYNITNVHAIEDISL